MPNIPASILSDMNLSVLEEQVARDIEMSNELLADTPWRPVAPSIQRRWASNPPVRVMPYNPPGLGDVLDGYLGRWRESTDTQIMVTSPPRTGPGFDFGRMVTYCEADIPSPISRRSMRRMSSSRATVEPSDLTIMPQYPLDAVVHGQYTFISDLGYMNRRIQMSYKLLHKKQKEERQQRDYTASGQIGWMDSNTGKIMTW